MKSHCLRIFLSLLLIFLLFPCSASATTASATTVSTPPPEATTTPEDTPPTITERNTILVEETQSQPIPEESNAIQVIYLPSPEGSTNSEEQTLKYTTRTAIATIFIPAAGTAFATWYSLSNQRKMKEFQLRMPKVYKQLDELLEAYDKLPRLSDINTLRPPVDKSRIGHLFHSFETKFHKVLPLVPDNDLHFYALQLISRVAQNQGHTDQDLDAEFF